MLAGSQLSPMAKISTLGSHFFTFSIFFVRVLLHNANVKVINVHKTQFFCLHFSQNKLKYFVVTDMKQMLI